MNECEEDYPCNDDMICVNTEGGYSCQPAETYKVMTYSVYLYVRYVMRLYVGKLEIGKARGILSCSVTNIASCVHLSLCVYFLLICLLLL